MDMSSRGVTRPMSQQEAVADGHDETHVDTGDGGTDDQGEGEGATDRRGDETPLERHHRLTLWIPWTIIVIGIWLIQAPFTLGYLDEAIWAVPSGGRGVWFSDADARSAPGSPDDLVRRRRAVRSSSGSGGRCCGRTGP